MIFSGCQAHKSYDFYNKTIPLKYGFIEVEMNPSNTKKINNDLVYYEHKNPYQFILSYQNDNAVEFCLNKFNLKDYDVRFEKKCNNHINNKKYSKKKFNKIIIPISQSIKHIDIKHNKILIELEVEITLSNGLKEKFIVNTELEPVYKEYKESDFINGIMSV